MEFVKKVHSQLDPSVKYVFTVNGKIVEFNYIDNGSDKDIICVPCQTMCHMSCKFCHLTDYVGKIKLENLTSEHICQGVAYVAEDMKLGKRDLLVSYMGCGEPLDNLFEVVESMKGLKDACGNRVRFGLATMLPKKRWKDFFELADAVIANGLNVKVHLSLHFTTDELRREWMPATLDINSSLAALKFYHVLTGNPIEVHYTMVKDVNTDFDDAVFLINNVPREATIKLMMYSKRKGLEYEKADERLIEGMKYLLERSHTVEYYEPPGNDIGASCGQFVIEPEHETNGINGEAEVSGPGL